MFGDAHPIEAHFVGEHRELEPLIVAALGEVGIAQGGRDGCTLEMCFGAGVVRAAQQGCLHGRTAVYVAPRIRRERCRFDEVVLHRPSHKLGTRVEVELGHHAPNVDSGRTLGNHEALADLAVGEPATDEPRYLAFPQPRRRMPAQRQAQQGAIAFSASGLSPMTASSTRR